jgi:type VI protein secretion system component VasK
MWDGGGVHVNLPGQRHHRPTSLTSPVLQCVLAAAVLALAIWSYRHAPTVRATDQWAYNFLAAVAGLLGLLLIPFAIAALVRVLRNRAVVPAAQRSAPRRRTSAGRSSSAAGWRDDDWS